MKIEIMWTEKLVANYINKIFGLLLSIGIVFLLTSGCSGGEMGKKEHGNDQLQTIDQIPQQKWDNLARKKIFFGHQSVGNNIISGINELLAHDHNIKLNIVETRDSTDFKKAIFAHYSIGKNDDPLSKISDFSQIINSGVSSDVDIAFMKFCFVDIKYGADINKIFQNYRESMDELKLRFPNITIVHFTVPLLKQEQEGIAINVKNFIKGLIGKNKDNFWANSHNAQRNEYNKLLVSYYSGKEPVFDIARLESTTSEGKRETFSYDGNEYYALAPEYTDDGGHLNEKGRQYMAEQLLIFLANL